MYKSRQLPKDVRQMNLNTGSALKTCKVTKDGNIWLLPN